MSNFEEEYMDVLQNIEFAVVNVYRKNRELTDYDVEKVLNALVKSYQAENQQRTYAKPRMSSLAEQVYESVQWMCEWRLGRGSMETEDGDFKTGTPKPISVDEVISCLRRVSKSVKYWTKQGGRRGYLGFIDQFIA
jgi:hypothetical protein